MRKIGIILGCDPRKNIGGVNKVINEVFSDYDNKKYELNYFFVSDNNFQEEENGRKYFGIKSYGISILKMFYFWKKIHSYHHKNHIDLFVDNTLGIGLYKLYPKTKIIQICHGLAYGSLHNVYIKNIFQRIGYIMYYRILHIIFKKTSKLADNVICMNVDAIEDLQHYYGIDKSKIVNIYNGVDFVIDKSEIKENTHINPIKVVFLGNNFPWKRIDIIENVAHNLRDENVEFLVIGPNYQPLHNNVKYVGYLSGKMKEKYIKSCDIVFMPSNYEGQNLVVMECMALGCIPLASNNTHVDVVKGTKLEIFISKENSVDFYCDKIRLLLQNRDKIEQYKNIAVDCVKPYLWKTQRNFYRDVIGKILE